MAVTTPEASGKDARRDWNAVAASMYLIAMSSVGLGVSPRAATAMVRAAISVANRVFMFGIGLSCWPNV